MIEIFASDTYATFMILPDPKPLPNSAENSDDRIRGRSLKFLHHGSKLLVSYLNHGVV